MDNYIALAVLSPVIIISLFIKNKKLFPSINLTAVRFLVFYYSVMIYVEYYYTVDSLNTHTMEDLLYSAEIKFKKILYHLAAVITFFFVNTIIVSFKLFKAKKAKPAV